MDDDIDGVMKRAALLTVLTAAGAFGVVWWWLFGETGRES
jgi:hypothetical protein